MQSSLEQKAHLHVAIIMDGNGRWATRRGRPRTFGHRAGVEAVRRVAEAASELGITKLTLFAFSADNWRRPATEVEALMALLHAYLRNELQRLLDNGTRLTVIGRRDRLPERLAREIAAAERATAHGDKLHLRIAIDYSARAAIAHAAICMALPLSIERFSRLITQAADDDASPPEVDLLIRTGGEKRLSDFLLWECAYAELLFTERMWPDFNARDLRAAVAQFRQRERRFGGLGRQASQPLGAGAAG
jgi:undecaprenyl diphosphate synthase